MTQTKAFPTYRAEAKRMVRWIEDKGVKVTFSGKYPKKIQANERLIKVHCYPTKNKVFIRPLIHIHFSFYRNIEFIQHRLLYVVR